MGRGDNARTTTSIGKGTLAQHSLTVINVANAWFDLGPKTTGAPDPKARGTEIIDQEKVLQGAQPTAETEHHHTSEGNARTDDDQQ